MLPGRSQADGLHMPSSFRFSQVLSLPRGERTNQSEMGSFWPKNLPVYPFAVKIYTESCDFPFSAVCGHKRRLNTDYNARIMKTKKLFRNMQNTPPATTTVQTSEKLSLHIGTEIHFKCTSLLLKQF